MPIQPFTRIEPTGRPNADYNWPLALWYGIVIATLRLSPNGFATNHCFDLKQQGELGGIRGTRMIISIQSSPDRQAYFRAPQTEHRYSHEGGAAIRTKSVRIWSESDKTAGAISCRTGEMGGRLRRDHAMSNLMHRNALKIKKPSTTTDSVISESVKSENQEEMKKWIHSSLSWPHRFKNTARMRMAGQAWFGKGD
jgi:hypothetical protein